MAGAWRLASDQRPHIEKKKRPLRCEKLGYPLPASMANIPLGHTLTRSRHPPHVLSLLFTNLRLFVLADSSLRNDLGIHEDSPTIRTAATASVKRTQDTDQMVRLCCSSAKVRQRGAGKAESETSISPQDHAGYRSRERWRRIPPSIFSGISGPCSYNRKCGRTDVGTQVCVLHSKRGAGYSPDMLQVCVEGNDIIV